MANHQQLAPLRRGFDILKALAEHEDWCSFSRLQALCGNLPAPTLSRLLRVLVDEALVEKHPDTGRYRKGPALLELAHTVLGSIPKARVLQPVIDGLADQTGQSAALFELEDNAIVMVAKAERPNSCHYISVGARNTDIARHGFARAILAFLDQSAVPPLLARAQHPPLVDHQAFAAMLDEVRDTRVCVERSESKPNWMRVTAPVFGGRTDGVPDAIGITVVDMSAGGSEDSLRAAVAAAARRASQTLHRYYAARIPEPEHSKGADK